MQQTYLDVARNFLAQRAPAPTSTGLVKTPESVEMQPYESASLLDAVTPLAAYRQKGSVRRCAECAHVLSVVAVRDVCGRCAARVGQPLQEDASGYSYEVSQRGLALVALDRLRYPRLRLPDGRRVGPGLEAWAPVLRGMDAEELAALAALPERTKHPGEPELEP